MQTERRDTYQVITNRIISILEEGVVPWKKPWSAGPLSIPKNLNSGKPYRGVNVFLLMAASYESPYWITFNQANERGGHVGKGEHGWPVVLWKWQDKEDVNKQTGEVKQKKIPLVRHYTVFNVAQCKDIEAPEPPKLKTHEFSPIERAEQIVQNMPNPPPIKHGSDRAAYRPKLCADIADGRVWANFS